MRRRWKRGAMLQVVLFISVWHVVAGAPGLAEPLVANLAPKELHDLLRASGGTTLAVAAATLVGTLLAIWIMRRYFGGPRLLDLGLRRGPGWPADVAVGLALGPVVFLAIVLVLLAAGWASVGPGTIGPSGLLLASATFVLVAVSEELFARGWVLQVLERGRGARVAVLGSATVFALLHAFNPGFGFTALLGLFLAGVLLAQAYVVTRRLWLPMALHLSWNVAEGPLFGFPVSGRPAEGLLTVTPTGPDLVTGGAFGPEAGLVVVVGIGVASGTLWWWSRGEVTPGGRRAGARCGPRPVGRSRHGAPPR